MKNFVETKQRNKKRKRRNKLDQILLREYDLLMC